MESWKEKLNGATHDAEGNLKEDVEVAASPEVMSGVASEGKIFMAEHGAASSDVSPPEPTLEERAAELLSQAAELARDALNEAFHRAGDFVEELGGKLEEKGYPRLGHVAQKLGDRIEHLPAGQ
jgi:hypothetical protein